MLILPPKQMHHRSIRDPGAAAGREHASEKDWHIDF